MRPAMSVPVEERKKEKRKKKKNRANGFHCIIEQNQIETGTGEKHCGNTAQNAEKHTAQNTFK